MIISRLVKPLWRPVFSQLLALAPILITFGPGAIPSAAQYVLTPIDDLNAASPVLGAPPYTMAHGVNDSGVVVGVYSGANNTFHGFQYASGAITTIDVQGPCSFSCGTEANGINNSGVVVGDYTDSAGLTHGYSSAGSNLTTIDFPGADLTIAFGVNNSGVVVGMYVDINNIEHGFRYSNGTITPLTFSGGSFLAANSINDSGDIVGRCVASGGTPFACKFSAATGQTTALTSPGATVSDATGINNAGQIVGTYSGGQFLFSGGSFTTLNCPLSGCGWRILSINNGGKIAGVYTVSQLEHGFLASGPELVDPVDPNLLSGGNVRTSNSQSDAHLLATKGQDVQGVAADGVTEVLVRIPATNVGDQFTLTLLNDASPPTQSSLSNEDGALGNPGDTSFSQSQLSVTAKDTGSGPSGPTPPYAFAIYRAPLDFARPLSGGGYKSGACAGTSVPDNQSACRAVSIQVQNLTAGTASTLQVSILRAPLVLVHGLWGDWTDWKSFNPLVIDAATVDSRFKVGRVSYNAVIGPSITSTNPPTTTLNQRLLVQGVRENSLGLDYNAPRVLTYIGQWIKEFKGGKNPGNIPVAAIQADIVAHSMGGLLVRTMARPQSILSDDTFHQGIIHKVINIDTPHLGSNLATELLGSNENGCIQDVLAQNGFFVFNSVKLSDGTSPSGAVADMQGDGLGGGLSLALSNIRQPGSALIPPTSLVVGVYQDFAAFGASKQAFSIATVGCVGDPLALEFTSTGWPGFFFNNQPNDAIVSENSQLDGLIPSPASQFFGYAHSPGTKELGFVAPTVLDAGAIPNQVIFLLNTPYSNGVYYNLLNP